MDPETEFLSGLIKLQYGELPDKRLVKIASKINWAKDWPKNKESFWNAEAFMWEHKIEKEKREAIRKELEFLEGKNLFSSAGSKLPCELGLCLQESELPALPKTNLLFHECNCSEQGELCERSEQSHERSFSEVTRQGDRRELNKFKRKSNLDLGCGSYSYIPSTGVDFSPKMLDFNENCIRKVKADLEEKLPFADAEFDSATAIFLLNYIKNYHLLLQGIHRVLKKEGIFVMLLSSRPINDWQRQKEVNVFEAEKWKKIIASCGFEVEFYEKEEMWVFKGRKRLPK